jgi:hypothetical protein
MDNSISVLFTDGTGEDCKAEENEVGPMAIATLKVK